MITPDFTAYALKVEAHFPKPVKGSEVKKRIEGLMTKITLECVSQGADLIGHIKSVTETESKDFLACSVVEPTGDVQCRGDISKDLDEISIVLNVLLYGLKREKVEVIVEGLARKELSFGGAHLHIEHLEEKHDHDHEHDHH